jgi:hypothetical protein
MLSCYNHMYLTFSLQTITISDSEPEVEEVNVKAENVDPLAIIRLDSPHASLQSKEVSKSNVDLVLSSQESQSDGTSSETITGPDELPDLVHTTPNRPSTPSRSTVIPSSVSPPPHFPTTPPRAGPSSSPKKTSPRKLPKTPSREKPASVSSPLTPATDGSDADMGVGSSSDVELSSLVDPSVRPSNHLERHTSDADVEMCLLQKPAEVADGKPASSGEHDRVDADDVHAAPDSSILSSVPSSPSSVASLKRTLPSPHRKPAGLDSSASSAPLTTFPSSDTTPSSVAGPSKPKPDAKASARSFVEALRAKMHQSRAEAASTATTAAPALPESLPRVPLRSAVDSSESDDELADGATTMRQAVASRQKALEAAARAKKEAEANRLAATPVDVSKLHSDRGKHSLANLSKQARAMKGKMTYEDLDRLAALEVRSASRILALALFAHVNLILSQPPDLDGESPTSSPRCRLSTSSSLSPTKDKAVRRRALANLDQSGYLGPVDKRVLGIVKKDLEDTARDAEWENERKLRTFWRRRSPNAKQAIKVCPSLLSPDVDLGLMDE